MTYKVRNNYGECSIIKLKVYLRARLDQPVSQVEDVDLTINCQ